MFRKRLQQLRQLQQAVQGDYRHESKKLSQPHLSMIFHQGIGCSIQVYPLTELKSGGAAAPPEHLPPRLPCGAGQNEFHFRIYHTQEQGY
jgi:hypothetical protein